MGLKIELVEINGEKRVHPETMEILCRFAGHRDVCDECSAAFKAGRLTKCRTGWEILKELSSRPDVSEAT
jgi:hypothetical protein